MTEPSDANDVFLTVYESIPDEWDDAQAFLVEQLREITNGVNERDIGLYYQDTTPNGQKWQPSATALAATDTPAEPRTVFRKIITLRRTDSGGGGAGTGGLNDFRATNPQNVAHGITTSVNFCITRLYGAASDPAASTLNSGIPLPYLQTSGTSSIGLEMDATNIILTQGATPTDMSAYECAWVVVEWINEA